MKEQYPRFSSHDYMFLFSGTIHSVPESPSKRSTASSAQPIALSTFSSCAAEVLLDTGATDNIIDEEYVTKCNIPTKPLKRSIDILLADGSSTSVTSTCTVQLKFSNFEFVEDFYVLPCAVNIILGSRWFRCFRPVLDFGTGEISANPQMHPRFTRQTAFPFRSHIVASAWCRPCVPPTSTLPHTESPLPTTESASSTLLPESIPAPSDTGTTASTPAVTAPPEASPPQRVPSKLDNQVFYLNIDGEWQEISIPPDACFNELRELIAIYGTLFSEPTELPPPRGEYDLHVNIAEDAIPFRATPRRLSPGEEKELLRQINELLRLGFIEPSSSEWAAPISFVKKKDGTLRLVCDYRNLNAVMRSCAYPLPNIRGMIDKLRDAKIFTSLDMKSGFFQLRVDPASSHLTAFTCPLGQFQWTVSSFGLSTTPNVFQRFMSHILEPHRDFCWVFIDDIIIASKSLDEHLDHVRQVLATLRNNKIKLAPAKCRFGKNEISYLGFVISHNTIKPDPAKRDAVTSRLPPTSPAETRAFVGLANYLRSFIPHFAEITAPLYKLCNISPSDFVWTPEAQRAFDDTRAAIAEADVLYIPDPGGHYDIETDASDFAIGSVLKQRDHDGKMHVVAFESRVLLPAEKNYSTTQKELLSIIHALTKWSHYVKGGSVTIYTDHKPLTYIQVQRTALTPRMARWVEFLQEFNVQIQYIEGPDNVAADALSRPPMRPMTADISASSVITCAPTLFSAITYENEKLSFRDLVSMCDQGYCEPVLPTLVIDTEPDAFTFVYPPKYACVATRRSSRKRTSDEVADANSVANTEVSVAPSAPSQSVPDIPATPEPPHASVPTAEVELSFTDRIRKATPHDRSFKELLRNHSNRFVERNGIVFRKDPHRNRVCIPKSLRNLVMDEIHRFCNHAGLNRTYAVLREKYFWPRMLRDVTSFVRDCHACQLAKPSTVGPQSLLRPLPVPSGRWESISMDFLQIGDDAGGLYNRVWIITDRLTKHIRLIPVSKSITAAQCATLFMKEIYAHHGLPSHITSDRDVLFTSNFWKELHKLQGTQLHFTTSFRPQGDGQAENSCKAILRALRTMVHDGSLVGKSWVEALPRVEFNYNNTYHSTIRTTPFEADLGRKPRSAITLDEEVQPDPAQSNVDLPERMRQTEHELQDNMAFAQQQQERFYNQGRKPSKLKVNDQVLVNADFISPLSKRTKLSTPYFGPFDIIEQRNESFKLDIPSNWKLHPWFNADRLKRYYQRKLKSLPDGYYQVDYVVNERGEGLSKEYLVKWANYQLKDADWVSQADVSQELVDTYQLVTGQLQSEPTQ